MFKKIVINLDQEGIAGCETLKQALKRRIESVQPVFENKKS